MERETGTLLASPSVAWHGALKTVLECAGEMQILRRIHYAQGTGFGHKLYQAPTRLETMCSDISLTNAKKWRYGLVRSAKEMSMSFRTERSAVRNLESMPHLVQ